LRAKGKRGGAAQILPPCDGIERVSRLKALGVVTNDRLTASRQQLVNVVFEAMRSEYYATTEYQQHR